MASKKAMIAQELGETITPAKFQMALEAAQAGRQNALPAAPQTQYYAGTDDDAGPAPIPAIAQDPTLVSRMLTGLDIEAFGDARGSNTRGWSNRGRVNMLSAGHPQAGKQSGMVGIWTSDAAGTDCAEPVVAKSADWAALFDASEHWGATHLAQPFPYSRGDRGFYTGANSQKIGDGFTFVVDLPFTQGDSGKPIGPRRFYASAREYFALVKPTHIGSVAWEVARESLGGRLPNSTDEAFILAARVVQKMRPRVTVSLLASVYLNAGLVMSQLESERVQRNILDPKVKMADAVLYLQGIRAENAKNRAARQNGESPVLAAATAAVEENIEASGFSASDEVPF